MVEGVGRCMSRIGVALDAAGPETGGSNHRNIHKCGDGVASIGWGGCKLGGQQAGC